MAPECAGATDLDIDVATTELRLPIRVFIDPRSLPDDPGIEPCLALTSIHEMGHALGIFAHSPDPEDIMFTDPGGRPAKSAGPANGRGGVPYPHSPSA